MTRVGFVRLRSGECLGKVLNALNEVSTRLYVAMPPDDDGRLQSKLSTIYGGTCATAPHVDTVVLLQDHRPADVSTLFGYADEAADAERAGWQLHVLSRSGPPEYLQPYPVEPGRTRQERDVAEEHDMRATCYTAPFEALPHGECYSMPMPESPWADATSAENTSCPGGLVFEDDEEERQRLREREAARYRNTVVDSRNWWDPFQSTEPLLLQPDGLVVPDRPEQMRHHPLTSLELVDVPHEFRSRFPAFCEWGKGAVLHMFEPIRKRDRKYLAEKRLLLVTGSNLYRCKATGVIDRCTRIIDIARLFVDGPGGRSVGIEMLPEHEHDMLYDFTSTLRAREFVEMVSVIHKCTGRQLNVTAVSAISDARLNFSRSRNYSFTLREVMLKEGLHKMCWLMKDRYLGHPGHVSAAAPQCAEPQPEQVQRHPFNGLPLVDVPFAFRSDFTVFDGAVLHMFELVRWQGSFGQSVLLVSDTHVYRCRTTGGVDRCTDIGHIAELIVDGCSVGIGVQALDNNSEDDMLCDFATPAQADAFTEIVQTVQDTLRSSKWPGLYNSAATLAILDMHVATSAGEYTLGMPKVLRAHVVHEPNAFDRLNFNRRSQHEKDMAVSYSVPMAKEHLLRGQAYVQAPPYQRQPFVPTMPELSEEIQRHPVSGLPLVAVPRALNPYFSSLCNQSDSVVMHMFEEIRTRDRKGSEPRLLVVFETSLQLWLPSATPERWASVDEIAELIIDGCSVGVKMQALDNSEHDMLYDFATPARAAVFTEIVQTIQDKLRSSKTLWAQVVHQPNPGARLNFDRPKNHRYQTRDMPRKGRLHKTGRQIDAVKRSQHETEQDCLEDAYERRAAAATQTPQYSHLCTGGTFNRLHNWHKVQLSHAVSCVKPGGRLCCDVAGDALFKESAWRGLMQPYGRRARVVRQFLTSIRPDVVCEVSELTAGYGPSINDPAMQAVAPRSWYGLNANQCRKERAKQGVPAFDVLLPANCCPRACDQPSDFGWLLTTQLMCKRNASKTYVIGITGGLASGKSTACQYFERKTEDVQVVHADELDGRAYAAGTDANRRIRELFPRAARADGSVDRKALDGCVFGAGNEGNLKKLTDIVWPVVADGIRGKIAGCRRRVLVVEAAPNLEEGGWAGICDEVWAVVVPPSAAKERLMERDCLTAEEAEARVASQIPDSDTTAHLLLPNLDTPPDPPLSLLEYHAEEAFRDLLSRVDVTFESLQEDGGGLPCRLASLLIASAHPATRAAHWWRELRDPYTRRGRDYHNLGHLDEMFGLLDTYRSKLARPDLVAYAVFFHDAVYDPTAKSPLNEERSADLWRVFAAENRAAGGRVTAEDEELVAAWIARTANHTKGEASGDLAYFLDMDLAVLGREAPHYAEYAEQISLEHSHVAYRDFVRLRQLALASFVDRPEGPYYTADFQAAFGQRALANVRAEMSRLREMSAHLVAVPRFCS